MPFNRLVKMITAVLFTVPFTLFSTELHAKSSCQVELTTGIDVNSTMTAFTEERRNGEVTEKHTLYKIMQGKSLLINNEKIKLNSSQQNLVTDYDAQIRQLIPQVRQTAVEGLDSAMEGVNLSFDGLLGKGNKVGLGLTQTLTGIKNKLANNLSIEKGISVGVEGLESDELLGKNFEQRIKSDIQQVIVNSMGDILMILGPQLFMSGGNFETRMTSFMDTIDTEMAERTAEIDKKTQVLCRGITKLELLEEKLKASVVQLSKINTFTITN